MKNYLTKERYKELKDELEKLKKDARADISERLKRAKEYGDLSENSEYVDAKEDQAKLEAQIQDLEELLRTAIMIPKTLNKEVVSVGSVIEVKKDNKTFHYTIVGSNEANPDTNLISNESPLGMAFINKKLGDTVEVKTPKGAAIYKILRIE